MRSIALGHEATVLQMPAIAIGFGARAYETGSVALGNHVECDQDNTVVCGPQLSIYAMGFEATEIRRFVPCIQEVLLSHNYWCENLSADNFYKMKQWLTKFIEYPSI